MPTSKSRDAFDVTARAVAWALAVWFACAALPALAATSRLSDYTGPDAGWLIVSTDECLYPQETKVSLGVRKVSDSVELVRPMSSVHKDFSNITLGESAKRAAEAAHAGYISGLYSGNVNVVRLAPGKYVLDFAQVEGFWGLTKWNRKYTGLQVPFEVTPGRSVYIGSIDIVALLAVENAGMKVFRDWRPVVSDQAIRDLPIAARKAPGLGPVDKAPYLDRLDGGN